MPDQPHPACPHEWGPMFSPAVGEKCRRRGEVRIRPHLTARPVTTAPAICGGAPCIAGTRVPVRSIRAFHAAGYSPAEIRNEYPALTIEQINAALTHGAQPMHDDQLNRFPPQPRIERIKRGTDWPPEMQAACDAVEATGDALLAADGGEDLGAVLGRQRAALTAFGHHVLALNRGRYPSHASEPASGPDGAPWPVMTAPLDQPDLRVRYTNYRGETATRQIRPVRLWFGSTEWHPEPQWLLTAVDMGKGELRDFAMCEMQPAQTEPAATADHG